MSKSTKGLEDEASAMVVQDGERGMLSVYVIMATLADEKGLSGELRQDELSDITAAMLAGEIPVYSRARRKVLQAPRKALSMDDIANVHDVRRWAARTAEGAYGTPPSPGANTHPQQVHARSTTPPRPPVRASKNVAANAPTTIAAAKRWYHLDVFKAKALNYTRSKSFPSRAEAARHAADDLEDKPGGKRQRYDWTTVDGWLKAAGWSAKMSWAEWVASLVAAEADATNDHA